MAGYLTEEKLTEKNLTIQQMTQDASKATYRTDLELLGTETALAYANFSMDITSSLLPEAEEDQWQRKSKAMFDHLNTALAPFGDFAQTTLSEGDAAVRRFAALNYTDSRDGDTVTLSISGRNGEVCFLFRTNGEDVKAVSGGSFTMLEDGAYLISAEQDTVSIDLTREDISHK